MFDEDRTTKRHLTMESSPPPTGVSSPENLIASP